MINAINQKIGKTLIDLDLGISQKSPQFIPLTGGFSYGYKITFPISDIPLGILPKEEADIYDYKTFLEATPPDVVLFHEILHWMHSIFGTKIEFKTDFNNLTNGILKDSPLVFAWYIDTIDRLYSILINKENRNDLYLSPWQGYDSLTNTPIFATIGQNEANTMALSLTNFVTSIDQYYKPKNGIQNTDLCKYINQDFSIPAVNLEEIQIIIGRERGYLSSADIQSENSYRLSRNEYKMNEAKFLANIDKYEKLNLRYGHIDRPCNIRKEILEWCIKLANEAKGAAQ